MPCAGSTSQGALPPWLTQAPPAAQPSLFGQHTRASNLKHAHPIKQPSSTPVVTSQIYTTSNLCRFPVARPLPTTTADDLRTP